MDLFLGKKKASTKNDDQLKQLTRQVEYLKRENSELRLQLDDSRQASHSNKMLIDQLYKLVGSCQASIKTLESRLEQVEAKTETHDNDIGTLKVRAEASDEQDDLLILEDSMALSQMH
mmetsp:Transcript_4028/g.8270  ORF Transcript_4028/g.8270 Transcript_4028/m.8270 type:complete len:118 (-) Transcript_4028:136-489(-)|eukprot:CAMPEP_0204905126 /NCGR_PEP_ID=MMETSP1397-20131031/5255_1 /ASSEMBLY_ACC=CAM_ASM_000891 /TAXON_ID=49980 /ORGANISM="Climacostomum Climacostomum virens, Strain Stock W-24" /LENGTH=117 /DNA_ID=CAMNT_0052073987 /DNA_START=116 /DNA_END=469 /DNA_ORIENTATION=-